MKKKNEFIFMSTNSGCNFGEIISTVWLCLFLCHSLLFLFANVYGLFPCTLFSMLRCWDTKYSCTSPYSSSLQEFTIQQYKNNKNAKIQVQNKTQTLRDSQQGLYNVGNT